MKNITKLLAFVAVFALVLAGVLALVACTETHVCGHKCTVSGCGKCTDASCKDPACADKCPGHEPAAHTCGHVCPTCGKCTDATCNDPVCKNNRCPGHTPASTHTCGHVCDTCGKCTDTTCTNPVCANNRCEGHDEPGPSTSPIASWWINEADGTLTSGNGDPLATITSIKEGSIQSSFKLATNYTPTADNKYLAIKYSGTASVNNVLLWGTGPNDVTVPGWSTGNVAAESDWLVPVKTIGSDYSVIVIDLGGGCGAYGVDTVTDLGFILAVSEGDTFVVHAIEFLASTAHNFGTPNPPEEEPPVERGDMEICAMVNDTNNAYTISPKADDGSQTVSREKYWGTAVTIVNVKFWDSAKKYLIIDFETNGALNFGVGTGSSWANLTNGNKDYPANTRETLVFDLSNVTFNDVSANIYFLYDSAKAWGADLDAGAATTITFHSITFSETDPNASTETNHFRTPTSTTGITYSESDKKLSYENGAAAYWRFVEIALDNHDVSYDILSVKVTGYDGLVLGVTVVIDGEPINLIASNYYYSKIETADTIDIVLYLDAYGLKGEQITAVRLYLDAPANAGKVGNVEITLDSIEMLKSDDLAPADTVITASNTTITAGQTPDFNATLKTAGDDGETIIGKIITEYRAKDEDGNYTGDYESGLPTAAGEYEVRFYYMGSREYNYSRETTVTLTIEASTEPEPEQHDCEHVCDTCGKCTSDCEDPACAEKCPGHVQLTIQAWDLFNKAEQVTAPDDVVSIKITDDTIDYVHFSTSLPVSAGTAYVAIKYSGTATFKDIRVWGTKDGTGSANNGWVAAYIQPEHWALQSLEIGTDFSVVVFKLGVISGAGQWDIDTVTNIGFGLDGEVDDTFVIHDIVVSANATHNLGTPTPVEATEA